jgi:hypothetical protein
LEISPDPETEVLVQKYLDILGKIKEEVVGETRDTIPCIKKQLRYFL